MANQEYGVDNLWLLIDERTNDMGGPLTDVPSTDYHRLMVTSGHSEGVRFQGGFECTIVDNGVSSAQVSVGNSNLELNQAFVDNTSSTSTPRYWVALRQVLTLDAWTRPSSGSALWRIGLGVRHDTTNSPNHRYAEIWTRDDSDDVPTDYVGGFLMWRVTVHSTPRSVAGPQSFRPFSHLTDTIPS